MDKDLQARSLKLHFYWTADNRNIPYARIKHGTWITPASKSRTNLPQNRRFNQLHVLQWFCLKLHIFHRSCYECTCIGGKSLLDILICCGTQNVVLAMWSWFVHTKSRFRCSLQPNWYALVHLHLKVVTQKQSLVLLGNTSVLGTVNWPFAVMSLCYWLLLKCHLLTHVICVATNFVRFWLKSNISISSYHGNISRVICRIWDSSLVHMRWTIFQEL